MTGSPNTVTVTGPAVPDTVRLLRAVAASLAMRAGATVDAIEGCKLVVDEAATLLLAAGDPRILRVDLDPSPDGTLRVAIASDARVEPWPGGRSGSWAWRVITHLSVGAGFETGSDGSPRITFLLRPEAADPR